MYHFSLFILSDVDECAEGTHDCHDNADCYDIIGSFVCMCSAGYSGDGVENCTGKRIPYTIQIVCLYIYFKCPIPTFSFPDIDECTLGTYVCDVNAYCENTIGSYDCICVDGFVENGTFCMSKHTPSYLKMLRECLPADVNECIEGTDNCHENADCYDTIGNFTCMCSPGYSGDGVDNCTGTFR